MKTVLKSGTISKVYGGSAKTKFTGRIRTRVRGTPSEITEVDFRITEDGDTRALENDDLRILE